MNFQTLLLLQLLTLATLSISDKSHNHSVVLSNKSNSLSRFFTSALLQNLQTLWKLLGTRSSVKFIFEEVISEDSLLEWNQIQTQGPYESFTKTINASDQLRLFPNKFLHTRSVVIFIVKSNTIRNIGKLGDPAHDHFIFVARNIQTLNNAFTHSSVIILNTLAHKYGMYLKEDKVGKSIKKIGYLIEPESYTGRFEKSQTLDLRLSPLKQLNGRVINVAYLSIAPVFKLKSRNNTHYNFEGTYHNLLVECANRANFTINYYGNSQPPGHQFPNGSWTGLMGELTTGKADITPVLGISHGRHSSILFTNMITQEVMVFSVRVPGTLLQWTALVHPLDPFIWFLTVVMLILFIILVYVTNMVGPGVQSHLNAISNAIMLSFLVLLEQPADISKRWTLRFVALLWVITGFHITMMYKGNLVGFLTFPDKQIIPKTFHQLSERIDYNVYLHTIGGLELERFKSSPSPTIKGLMKRLIVYKDSRKCILKATQQRTACIAWSNFFLTGLAKYMPPYRKKEMLYVATEPIGTVEICFGVRKGSIYIDAFNYYSSIFVHCGLMQKWRLDIIKLEQRKLIEEDNESNHDAKRSSDGGNDDDDERRPLGSKNLLAVYTLFIFGCVISSIVYVYDEVTLLSTMEQSQAINTVASKYGLIITENVNTMKYLVEPVTYTGKFVEFSEVFINNKFNNLNGRTLRVVHMSVGTTFRHPTPESKTYVGVYYKLLSEAAKKSNFTMDMYKEKIPPRKLQANGSWTGMMGELQQGNADFAAALEISLQRFPYVDYATMTYREIVAFCVRKPKALLQWHALISPLTPRLWFLHVEQPANFSTGPTALRITAILCVIQSFVIGTAYKTNLIGFLTFPEQPNFPKSYIDLSENKEFSLILGSVGGMEHEFFRTSTSPIINGMWMRMRIEADRKHCLEATLKSKTACFSWKNVLKIELIKNSFSNPDLKELYMTDDPMLSTNMATVFKKGCIYQRILNRYFAIARDTGLVSEWLKKFWYDEEQRYRDLFMRGRNQTDVYKYKRAAFRNEENEERPLKIGNLVAISFAYFFGCILASACLLIEMVTHVMARSNFTKGLGDPIHDDFIFISRNLTTLLEVLTRPSVINTLSSKYGMFLQEDRNNTSSQNFGYVIEPETHTGQLERSQSLHLLQTPREQLNGRVISMAFLNISPIFYMVEPNSTQYNFEGSYNNLFMDCAKRGNFTITYYGKPEIPGHHYPNGSWSGLMRELTTGKADMTPVLAMAYSRYPNASFTNMVTREELVFAVRVPSSLLQWSALIHPLEPIVWLLTGVMLVIFILLAYISSMTSKMNPKGHLKAIDSAIMLSCLVLLEQPYEIPKRWTLRFIALLWIVMSFHITMMYKGNLFGFLTFPDKQTIPKTFQELHERNEYSVNLYTIGGVEIEQLKNSASPILKGLLKRLNVYKDSGKCIRRAADEKGACIAWKNFLLSKLAKYLPPQTKQEILYITNEPVGWADLSIAMRKGSIYFGPFNYYSGIYVHSGLMEKWNYDFVKRVQRKSLKGCGKRRNHGSCTISNVNDDENEVLEKPLSISNLLAVYSVLIFGCMLSSLIFLCEYGLNYVSKPSAKPS
ncbi:unnamed protein product [Orchesella dallaii]|uniref:Uncharacterized protein n=1 Tax=Orchesella dallaii TaxID=48710 RepID=A0ABP1PMV0_9HEXA